MATGKITRRAALSALGGACAAGAMTLGQGWAQGGQVPLCDEYHDKFDYWEVESERSRYVGIATRVKSWQKIYAAKNTDTEWILSKIQFRHYPEDDSWYFSACLPESLTLKESGRTIVFKDAEEGCALVNGACIRPRLKLLLSLKSGNGEIFRKLWPNDLELTLTTVEIGSPAIVSEWLRLFESAHEYEIYLSDLDGELTGRRPPVLLAGWAGNLTGFSRAMKEGLAFERREFKRLLDGGCRAVEA